MNKFNPLKIQTKLMKESAKRGYSKAFPYVYGIDTAGNILITESHYIIKISPEDFYLNLEAIFMEHERSDSIFRFYEQCFDDSEKLEKVCIMTVGDKQCIMLRNLKQEEIYIDSKLLAEFGIKYTDDITYVGKGAKSPVYMMEDNDCIGCICPINRR